MFQKLTSRIARELTRLDLPYMVIECMVLPVLDEESGIKVDFIFSFTSYEKEAIRRAKKVDVEGVEARIASIEDLIIHKMFAGRPRDIDDIKSILLKNKGFDKGYVNKWLKQFGELMSTDFVGKFAEVLNGIETKE